MQYEQTIEKVAMIDGPPAVVIQRVPMTKDPPIQRIRKYLFVILGVFFGLSLIYTIYVSFALILSIYAKDGPYLTMQLVISVLPLFGYGFGIFVAYKYWTTGLRIFAWISVILSILAGLTILIKIIGILSGYHWLSRTKNDNTGGFPIYGVIEMVLKYTVCAVVCCLTIPTILSAFKLAILIDDKSSLSK